MPSTAVTVVHRSGPAKAEGYQIVRGENDDVYINDVLDMILMGLERKALVLAAIPLRFTTLIRRFAPPSPAKERGRRGNVC